MKNTTVYIIEGLDRVGKSGLVQGIKDKLGFFQVLHFSKPEKLEKYVDHEQPLLRYQIANFNSAMIIAKSGARLIYDRSWIGESVWAPLYRNYSGDYVFQMEKDYKIDQVDNIRLILLTENFFKSKHFIDDGKSLGTSSDRPNQQGLFLDAYYKTSIQDKKIICVTDTETGQFKRKEQILEEALS